MQPKPRNRTSSPTEILYKTLDVSPDAPKTRQKATSSLRPKNFNKYYINPELRYREKVQNPKEQAEKYQDETYIYKNLHNYQFWNWAHPLDEYQLKPNEKQLQGKVNLTVLERFKSDLEKKGGNRVPIVVREILNHR